MGVAFLSEYTKALKFDMRKVAYFAKIFRFVATPLGDFGSLFGAKR